MSTIGQWFFCSCVKQDIIRFAGEEVYAPIGQQVIDALRNKCSENFELVRFPEDEEVIDMVYKVQKEMCSQ